jgi:Cu/Zn superoxide dismutase
MTVTKRIATITAAALAVSVCGPAAAQAGPAGQSAETVVAHGQLRDLQPAAGPFDNARAVVVMVQRDGHSMVLLQVAGIERTAAEQSFGAHLHVGPCVAGNGAAAGPHYNADVVAGRVPPRVNATTEVWLDFTVTRGGTGSAMTYVPFAPLPGNRSVVIHQEPTNPQGAAGPRLACLPVSW